MLINKIWKGFWFGLICGSATAFFRGPRLNWQRSVSAWGHHVKESAKSIRKNVSLQDTLKDSLHEGKLAAHQRRRDAN